MPVSIHVGVRSVRIGQTRLLRLAEAMLQLVGEPSSELSVSLVGDRHMRQLNRRFRHRDRSTDVLAFAFREARAPHGFHRVARYLGDVVIALPTARRQAEVAGRPVDEELVTLLIHGLLHLCGYDHERSKGEALRMRRKEEAVRRRLGSIARFVRRNRASRLRARGEV